MKDNIKFPDFVDDKTMYKYYMTYCNECPRYYYSSAAYCDKCREIRDKMIAKWKSMKEN